MSTYLELLDGVRSYYGSGSDQWVKLASQGITPETIEMISQVPGVTITRSRSGSFLGYDYANPFPTTYNPIADIDSNIAGGSYGLTSYQAGIPATAVTDPTTGKITMASGSVGSTAGSVVRTVADKVTLAAAGVALGTKLGLAIDTALYSAAPQWWDEHFPSLNPEAWNTLIPEGAGGDMVRSMIGIGADGSATMYMDERLLGYAYMALLKGGAWSTSGDASADWHGSTVPFEGFAPEKVNLPISMSDTSMWVSYVNQKMLFSGTSSSSRKVGIYWYNTTGKNWKYTYLVASPDQAGATGKWTYAKQDGSTYETFNQGGARATYGDKTFYWSWRIKEGGTTYFNPLVAHRVADDFENTGLSYTDMATIAYIMLYGDITDGRQAGMEDNPSASYIMDPSQIINPSTGVPVTPEDSVDDVVDALRTAYPDLFSNGTYQDIPQEDGTVSRISYIPVPYPTTDQDGNPVTFTGVDPQTDPQIDPQTRPDAAQGITDSVTGPPSPPDTGSGDSPAAVIPSGSTNALFSIYNPSQTELNSFGGWLWSPNFVDQILKAFSDPMQAIIGLHKVFCAPSISGRGHIKVGYLDSGVESNLVASQYVTVDCGSVLLREYFGNALDYSPFTRAQIYLPFIGIQPLDVGDVMRSSVHVTYHIDVLTGACLAEVDVTRDGAGGTLYAYSGSAAVQYPISSGSYMGIVSSLLAVAGGIAGTIASGGMLAPVALGAMSGMMGAKTRVEHSGSFSGNSGAMGARIPYLIITRPQSAVADNFEMLEGAPANHATTLGRCSGLVRCKVAHMDGIPATSGEMAELEKMLADGIIL